MTYNDFTLKRKRYTKKYFKTKAEAREAEARRREAIKNPQPLAQIPTGMGFLDLVNLRLDYVKAYRSPIHYQHYCYMAKRWVKRWGKLICSQITQQMVQQHVFERSKVSAFTANKG